MRFAISLLITLAIASIIGTVLKQNEPYPAYILEFGQFWFGLFELLGFFDIYHSGWFLTILGFLIISTSLCIYRHLPLMLKEMRGFREHASYASLNSFSHRMEYPNVNLAIDDIIKSLGHYLTGQGFRFRVNSPANASYTLIAAKAGSYQRLGYFLTHAAIIVICIGGLIDGNIPLKLQELVNIKSIETRDIPANQVPDKSRLSFNNLSFRGNITIPEGSNADIVFINIGKGYMVQELPFHIKLEKFYIEHYRTGQPKLFASDLMITDKLTRQTKRATIKVNQPLFYNGIAIYQASFGDGGSKLQLRQWDLFSSSSESKSIIAHSLQKMPLIHQASSYMLELGEFRLFNIEDFSREQEINNNRFSKLTKITNIAPHKDLRNIGPSIQYKMRDSAGQAREYQNYMLPIVIEDSPYLVSGVRSAPNQPFIYFRFPLDDTGSIESFMALRSILFNRATHQEIANRVAASALKEPSVNPIYYKQFIDTTRRVLTEFIEGGFDRLELFLKQKVPADKRDQVGQTYLKILQAAALEAYQMASKQKESRSTDQAPFILNSLIAISSSLDYGSPVLLQLTGFEEVKATGLQLTKAPGKNIVYLGFLLLVLGTFAMLYIRERRIWFFIRNNKLLFAMSSNRKNLALEKEFSQHCQAINTLIQG